MITKTCRLSTMLLLTFSFFLVELIVGHFTKSLTLVADAFHMLSDVLSLLIGLFAVRIAKRRSNINTFGWVRAEVVGANINTVFLLALCLTIVFDAVERFIEPKSIENPDLLLIVGSIGLGINLIGLCLFQGFHGHSHGHEHGHEHGQHQHSHQIIDKSLLNKQKKENIEENFTDNHNPVEQIEILIDSSDFKRHSLRALDEVIVDCSDQKASYKKTKAASMNMHGVFLHVLADALGSVVVIISSLIIKFVPRDPENVKHWTVYVDPTLSVIIVIIITISSIPLLKQTTYVLLQTVPNNIEVNSLKQKLLEEIPEIDGIHDLHIWRLNSNAIIATAHLRRKSLTDYMDVASKVKKFFHDMGVHATTIQYEPQIDDEKDSLLNNDKLKESNVDCLLYCPDESCNDQTCCTKDSIRHDGIVKTNPNQQIVIQVEGQTTTTTANGVSNAGFTSEKF